MGSISIVDCERFLAKKTVEASAITARKYYLALSAAFDRARTWGMVKKNVWRDVKKPRVPETLPLFLTRDEFVKLRMAILDDAFRHLVEFAAMTGMRLGELRAMRWDWVDMNRRVVVVRNSSEFTTKSKKSRVIPLCPDALMVLEQRTLVRHQSSSFVFHRLGRPLSEDAVSHGFKRAVRRAGLRDQLHFHSLRHTFASWLVEAGASLYHVSRLMGHASPTTTAIYAHLAPDQLHSVLAPLSLSPPSPVDKESTQRGRPDGSF